MSIDKLSTIGLTKKEADLYLAALESGISSITELAKLANIKRPTAYLILEDLLNKNLLIPSPVGKNIHYIAGDPIILAKDLELKRTILANLLPELKNLYKNSQKIQKSKIDDRQKKVILNSKEFKAKNIQSVSTINRFFLSFSKKK
jgi:sugar-specific transcriptional regulator TrmB